MGALQEVTVVRRCDSTPFEGHAWSRDDGTFEAWWYEDGVRFTFFFEANGRQIATLQRYTMKLHQ